MYKKHVENNIVLSASAIDSVRTGNITEAEYNLLIQMIHDTPEGKVILDNDGKYAYGDASEDEDEPYEEEPTAEEIVSILTGETE